MAAGSQTTLILVAVIGIAAIGGFFLLKRRGMGAEPTEMPPDAEAAGAAGDKFWETLPLPGTATEIGEPAGGGLTSIAKGKVGVPITGGINFGDAGAFSPLEAGNCQCDNDRCYYYQPFFTKSGEYKTNYAAPRKSIKIQWGDKVTACEKLLSEFEIESHRYAESHFGKVQRAISSPAAGYFARARLARTGLV